MPVKSVVHAYTVDRMKTLCGKSNPSCHRMETETDPATCGHCVTKREIEMTRTKTAHLKRKDGVNRTVCGISLPHENLKMVEKAAEVECFNCQRVLKKKTATAQPEASV